MSRLRRFKVDSLTGAQPGGRIAWPQAQRRHVQVLRLQPGAEVELFDGAGRVWRARLSEDGTAAELVAEHAQTERTRTLVVVATAWPKGKRAATLVEKCTELGVDEIVPLHCARSVVLKDTEGEGVERLRRIAAEAAELSGRSTVPVVSRERTIVELLGEMAQGTLAVLLDPRAEASLLEVLQAAPRPSQGLFLIGPEGGFTAQELLDAQRLGARTARLGAHILRVETAAAAVCAVATVAFDAPPTLE